MSGGIPWGEDLERDCRALRALEVIGIYPGGYHNINCPIDHTQEKETSE
jgi:hypothetical protein